MSPDSRPLRPRSVGHRGRVDGPVGQMVYGERSGLLQPDRQPAEQHSDPACGRAESHPDRPQAELHLLPVSAGGELHHCGVLLKATVCSNCIEPPAGLMAFVAKSDCSPWKMLMALLLNV